MIDLPFEIEVTPAEEVVQADPIEICDPVDRDSLGILCDLRPERTPGYPLEQQVCYPLSRTLEDIPGEVQVCVIVLIGEHRLKDTYGDPDHTLIGQETLRHRMNELPQPLFRGCRGIEDLPGFLLDFLNPAHNRESNQIFLGFEVFVDGALPYSGGLGDLTDGRLIKLLLFQKI